MTPDFFSQLVEAAPVIISLIIIEGLLSVDNMLVIATMASQLPEHQKKSALRAGLAGAYIFRGVALCFVGLIMANEWVKFIGAFYLLHLMADHFSDYLKGNDGNPHKNSQKPKTFWAVVISIQLMDLSLSVDNVVAAVAMSPKMWVIVTGVCLGLLTLWMFASLSLKIVEKFPILQHTAFLLIGYVGLILLTEMTAQYGFHTTLHIGTFSKFIGIAVIMALSILYARSAKVQKICKPLFYPANQIMIGYAKITVIVIEILLWPFKKLRPR
jgi:tellurite resistance protein TerC